MKVMHFDCHTPEVFGYSDEAWVQSKRGFGPNVVLARFTRELGWACSAHYFTRARQPKFEVWDGLTFAFHPVSLAWLPASLVLPGGRSISIYRHQLQFSRPFLRYVEENPPDVMVINITSGLSSFLVSRLLRRHNIPYIAHLHGGDYHGSPIRRRFMERAAAIITTSRFEQSEILRRYHVHPSDVHVIPVGVDTERFLPAESAPRDRLLPRLLFVGRIIRPKGVSDAVRCLREILPRFPNASLDIVGPVQDPTYAAEIRTYIEAHDLDRHVRFFGARRNEELPALYQSADFLIFPSTREGNPGVVMESMACGTPVIALRETPGANEVIVDGHNGVLCATNEIAAAVMELAGDPDRVAHYAEQGRRRIEDDYSLRNTHTKHLNLYRSIASGNTTSRGAAESGSASDPQ